MTEKELIGKIRELRQIQPSKDWVSLTKSQILGEETYRDRVSVSFFPFWKPALATVTALGILFGIFSLAQNSLPGDFLYPIKKITEKSQAVFVSEEEKPAFQLKLANERLEDLTKAPVKNLASTINEFQANISEAVKGLKATSSDPEVIKGIVEQTQKLKKNKQKVEALGIVVGDGEIEKVESTIDELIGRQIKIWELQIDELSDELEVKEEFKKLLKEAEEYYSAGDYYPASQALEKIYLSYPQP